MNTHYVRIWGWWVHKGTITIFPLLIHPSCWTARFLIHRQSVNFLRMYMYVCYSSQQVKKIIYLSKPAIVLRFPCWFHLFAGVCTCISIFWVVIFSRSPKKAVSECLFDVQPPEECHLSQIFQQKTYTVTNVPATFNSLICCAVRAWNSWPTQIYDIYILKKS